MTKKIKFLSASQLKKEQDAFLERERHANVVLTAKAFTDAVGTKKEKKTLRAFKLAQAREELADLGYKELPSGNFIAPPTARKN